MDYLFILYYDDVKGYSYMKKLKYILYYFLLLSIGGNGSTLEALIQENIRKNPQIRGALANYESAKYELEKSKANFKPTLDVYGEVGRERTEIEYSFDGNRELNERELSLVGRYNLFDGYRSSNEMAEKESALSVAKNQFLEKVNKTALLMVQVYLNVLRQKSLLEVEEESYQNHLETLEKVRLRLESGDGYESNYRQTKARLKLAQTNRLLLKKAYLNAKINYRRLMNRLPNVEEISLPTIRPLIKRGQLDKALEKANQNNRALAIEQQQLAVTKAQYAQEQSKNYPTFDLELSQTLSNNAHGFKGKDNSYKVAVVMNYNLYRGGADQASQLSLLKKSEAQESIVEEVKLNIKEELDLTLMKYEMLEEQLALSEEQLGYLEGTKELYELEYQNSKRTIIDLLNIKQEYAYAKSQQINAKFDQLLTYYQYKKVMNELVDEFHLDELWGGL